MQFLIVLVAAVACAIAEPQFAYNTVQHGYTGVGYTGGVLPVGYTGAVAYAAPLTYSGHGVNYPVAGTYPVGYYPVKDGVISRSRRDTPASTYPLAPARPLAYTTYPYGAPTPYAHQVYSPVAYGTYGHPGSVLHY